MDAQAILQEIDRQLEVVAFYRDDEAGLTYSDGYWDGYYNALRRVKKFVETGAV